MELAKVWHVTAKMSDIISSNPVEMNIGEKITGLKTVNIKSTKVVKIKKDIRNMRNRWQRERESKSHP